jgi:hypothetical protein
MEAGTGPRRVAVEQPATSGREASWEGADGARRKSATGVVRKGTCERLPQVVLAHGEPRETLKGRWPQVLLSLEGSDRRSRRGLRAQLLGRWERLIVMRKILRFGDFLSFDWKSR